MALVELTFASPNNRMSFANRKWDIWILFLWKEKGVHLNLATVSFIM